MIAINELKAHLIGYLFRYYRTKRPLTVDLTEPAPSYPQALAAFAQRPGREPASLDNLITALITAPPGFTGIAGLAVNIAWILFLTGLLLAVILFTTGRRTRV